MFEPLLRHAVPTAMHVDGLTPNNYQRSALATIDELLQTYADQANTLAEGDKDSVICVSGTLRDDMLGRDTLAHYIAKTYRTLLVGTTLAQLNENPLSQGSHLEGDKAISVKQSLDDYRDVGTGVDAGLSREEWFDKFDIVVVIPGLWIATFGVPRHRTILVRLMEEASLHKTPVILL